MSHVPNDSAVDRLIDRLAEATEYAPKAGTGGEWNALCPAHDDRTPSLGVRPGPGGALLYCRAGCATADVLAALNMSLADLYDEPRPRSGDNVWTPCGPAVAVYEYRDEQGRLLYESCRTADKQFPVRVPDATKKSGYRWRLDGVRRVLYRLPQLIEAVKDGRRVWICEGEKDADALASLGEAATCNLGGAGKWRPEYAEHFRGATVVVVADRDEPGRKHAAQGAGSLSGVAADVRIVEAKAGKDAADHLAAGYNLDEFVPADTAAGGDPPTQDEPVKPVLTFLTVTELRARVAAAGPRKWLLRGLWPAGDYGVHAGEMKAQKTWNTVAVAVAVASGTPWLGTVPVDLSGPVVMFCGEGGEADMLRRIDAVATSAGVNADDLSITICARAPHLRSTIHLGEMADHLDKVRPVLATLDPFYLSAGGAKGSDLYAMGELLERPQHLCQAAGTGLWVATHLNRKEGRGAGRITGAGPAEWGRVLATAVVKSRKLNPTTTETTVITELDFIGGSIPGGTLRVTRRIRAEHPDDLDSPLHHRVDAELIDGQQDTEETRMPPARAKLLEALKHFSGTPATVRQLVDRVATVHGHGLTRETCSRELNALLDDGLADRIDQGSGRAAEWFATDPEEGR